MIFFDRERLKRFSMHIVYDDKVLEKLISDIGLEPTTAIDFCRTARDTPVLHVIRSTDNIPDHMLRALSMIHIRTNTHIIFRIESIGELCEITAYNADFVHLPNVPKGDIHRLSELYYQRIPRYVFKTYFARTDHIVMDTTVFSSDPKRVFMSYPK